MTLTIIAAHDPDLVIGKDGRLPWHLPEDLKHFKQRTIGHTVIMGRRVYEEIGQKPLPNRRNLVISRKEFPEVEVHRSLSAALAACASEKKVYIIGGGVLYRAALSIATRLEITLVHQRYGGDVFFPEYRPGIGIRWKEVFREAHKDYTFVDYEMK